MKRYALRMPPDVSEYLRHRYPFIRARLRRALEAIEGHPFEGKPLQGPLTELYSFRVARYRIVYEVIREAHRIAVVDIADREVVYRRVMTILGH